MSHNTSEHVEPDMTAMLDMVFQLITFFMLVINFKSASLDLELKLPVIGSAKPVDTGGRTDLVILNINERGELTIFGAVKPDIETYIENESRASLLAAQRKNPKFDKKDDLPSTVVIRADKATPFKLLNRVIKACQENGFRNFALRAMDKEPDKVK